MKDKVPEPSVARTWFKLPSEEGMVNCGPPEAGGLNKAPSRTSLVAVSCSILSPSRSSKRKSDLPNVEVYKRTSSSTIGAGLVK